MINNNRRYYLHQRIKRIAKYNPLTKEISIPSNIESVFKNRYIIELRDVYHYNLQTSIPLGSVYINHAIKDLTTKLELLNTEIIKTLKAIEALQNTCEHKFDDGKDACIVVAHTHKQINECSICLKTISA